MLGMKKTWFSQTVQPINIVTEAVAAKTRIHLFIYLFMVGDNTNRWKQQVSLQTQSEGPVCN